MNEGRKTAVLEPLSFRTAGQKLKLRLAYGFAMIAMFLGLTVIDARFGREISSWLGFPAGRGHLPVSLLGYFMAATSLYELTNIFRVKGYAPHVKTAQVFCLILFVVQVWMSEYKDTVESFSPKHWFLHVSTTFLGIWLFALIFFAFFTEGVKGSANATGNIAITVFATLYVAFCTIFFVKIAYLPGVNSWGIFYVGMVAKSADIGGYLVGRKWGRHKIVPSISPNKSWEGSLAGFALSIVVAVLLIYWPAFDGEPLFGLGWIGWKKALVFGVTVGVMSQFGDWGESLIKRDCGVKDSNTLIPEFGGFLDLQDCLLAVAPVAFVNLYVANLINAGVIVFS